MTAEMTYNYLANINATEAPAHFVPYNNTDDVWNKNWTQQEVDPGGLPHGPPFGPPPPTQEELMLQVYINNFRLLPYYKPALSARLTYWLMFIYILANNPKYQITNSCL